MFTTFALLESFPITVRGTSVHWREAVETCCEVATRSLVGATKARALRRSAFAVIRRTKYHAACATGVQLNVHSGKCNVSGCYSK
jgi:hypothetical protein